MVLLLSQLKSLFVDEQNSKRSCITFRFTIGPQLIVQFPKPNALSPLLQCKNDGPNVQRQNGELRVGQRQSPYRGEFDRAFWSSCKKK